MSLVDKVAGNATQGTRNLDIVQPILIPGEQIDSSYDLVSSDFDIFIHTRGRISTASINLSVDLSPRHSVTPSR